MSIKISKIFRVLLGALSFVLITSCSGSEFTGASSNAQRKSGDGKGNNGGPDGGSDSPDSLTDSDKNGLNGGNNAGGPDGGNDGGVDSDTGNSPGGIDGGGGGSGNNLGNNDSGSGCSNGCCPSSRIAFVDCSGKVSNIKKGKYDIDVVACDKATDASLAKYDTIVYHGSPKSSKLPAAIDAKLAGGAKVIAAINAGAKIDNFYGLALDIPILPFSAFPKLDVSVTSANTMSKAFNKNDFPNSTVGAGICPAELSVLGCKQDNWCSDLLAKSGARQTPFHAYLLDDGSRKGFLSFMTIKFGEGEFDFSNGFFAANLQQKWNRSGNSKSCNLACTTIGRNGSNGKPGGISEAIGIGKPVVYLYPTKEQDVTVKLDFDGKLETTYPAYDAKVKGWQVRAWPDGRLVDKRDNLEYSFIYWNGTSEKFKHSMDEGFVVKGEDTRKFLQEKLAYMGMSPREYNDMIVYWLPYMENHKYNLISFAHKNYTDIAKMEVTPKPDSMLRVFMVYKELQSPIAVKPQKLERFERKGFSVIEWGGTEIGGDWSVIH